MAQYADLCNVFGDVPTVAHKVEVLRGHCADVGRDPAEVTVSRLSTLVLTANADETAATKDFLRQVTGEEPSSSDVGTLDELATRMDELASGGRRLLHLQHADGDAGHGPPGRSGPDRSLTAAEARPQRRADAV